MFKIKTIGILLIFLIGINSYNYSQSYSIDNKQKKKVHVHISLRKIFVRDKVGRTIRKTEKKEQKKIRISEKFDRKAIKKYQKRNNKPDYVHTDKNAYKRMKKTKRTQNRLFNNDGREPLVKRIFRKDHDRKKAKLSKEDRKRVKDPFLKKIFKPKKKNKKH
ncbi:MAG: hypothetical protein ABIJ97_17790 [Bacteroidota bacterium]